MKSQTIARGYRLKAATHKLIKKVQDEFNLSQDKVILRAVKLFYKSIKSAEDPASKVINTGEMNARENTKEIDTKEIDTKEIDTKEINTQEINTQEINTQQINTQQINTGN